MNKIFNQFMSNNIEDKLLDNENLPLDELLEHEDILNEFKFTKIQKINTYLDNSKIKKLIDYAIKEPFDDSFKYGHKFPFICSEILSSEIQLILDKFFPEQIGNLEESKSILLNLSDSFCQRKDEDDCKEKKESPHHNIIQTIDENVDEILFPIKESFVFNPPAIEFGYTEKEKENSFNFFIDKKFYNAGNYENNELLDYLFSFLSTYSINNQVLCGNFAKIVISFFRIKNQQLLRYICNKRQDILPSLISNICHKSICDILIKLLLSDNCFLEESMSLDILKVTILNKLLIYLQSTNISEEEIGNTTYIFSDYFEYSKNTEIISNEQFLNNLTNLWNSKFNLSLKEGLMISNKVIRQFKLEYEKAQKFFHSVSLKSKLFEKTNYLSLDQDNILIFKFSNCLDHILEIFTNFSSNEKERRSSLNYLTPLITEYPVPNKLGTLRVTILEIIYNLLILSRNNSILERFRKYKFFETCITYFFHFHFNDILNYLVLHIFNLIIEEANEIYIDYLFNNCSLLSEIMKHCENNECFYYFNSKRKCHKGYFVACVRLCYAVNQLLEKSDKPAKKLIMGIHNYEQYLKFYEINIKPFNEKMNYTLGGMKTNQSI